MTSHLRSQWRTSSSARQEVLRLVEEHGLDLDDFSSPGEFRVSIWSPAGVKFVASDGHALGYSFHSDRPAGWRAALEDLRLGLEPCTREDCDTCLDAREAKTAMPMSWRPVMERDWRQAYDAVVLSDVRSRGQRHFEVYTYGQPLGQRWSLDEAKALVEDIYGPVEWRRRVLEPIEVEHYYFGPATEFTDPVTIHYVERLPDLLGLDG